MGRKLRHLLIFLLIAPKEPNLQVDGWFLSTPKADCKCAPSPRCDCGNLGLTSIPKNLPKSICSLDLSTNKIKKIQPGAFANLLWLEELDLCYNKLTNIQPGAFSNLPRLQVLKVINNQIRNIQPGTFANLPQLEELRLADNDMTLIQPGVFSNLPRLQSLELSRNQIKMIQPGTFANLPQLKTLDLSDNQMGKTPPGLFTNIPQLEELYLNRYQIMILPGLFANIPQLKELYLSSNQLTKIHPGTFANLPGLEKLVLASNQITMIQEGAYPTKLQYLDLRSNKISAITPLAYGMLKCIPHIHLRMNPWQCDCKMLPLRLDITDFPSFKNQIYCAQPSKFRHQNLADINPEELICEEPTKSILHVDGRIHFGNCSTPSGSTVGRTDKIRRTPTSPTTTTPENTESNSFNAIVRANTRYLANPLYASVETPPNHSNSTSVHGQTARGQSHTSTKINSNVSAGAMTSGEDIHTQHDQIGQGHSHATPESNTKSTTKSTSATVVTSGDDHQYEEVDKHDDQTGQDQSQAITKINSNTTSTEVSTAHDHQYKDTDNQHDQTGQGQSQAIADSLDARNESYGTGPTALQPNPLYKFGSSESQPGSLDKFVDQHQADTNALNNVPPRLSTPRDDGIYLKPDDALSTRPASLYEMPPNKICDNDTIYCQPTANI
uniref:LRRCT domain-containing protein n=1 Tax=Branchiostoma floridae TaxID=7739 RepID=C3ZL06_BRAFL|eukprot:XP_002590677.1 hypothetical protein BRAFLDRAFT_89478 [Branchiostoma floridae]